MNPIKPIRSEKYRKLNSFTKEKKSSTGKIQLDVEVQRQKIVLRAEPEYASSNIIIYADNQQVFTGSLSRNADISLSLSNKEGKRILKEYNRNKVLGAVL